MSTKKTNSNPKQQPKQNQNFIAQNFLASETDDSRPNPPDKGIPPKRDN